MTHEKLKNIYERNKILREPRWKSYHRREINKGRVKDELKIVLREGLKCAPANIYYLFQRCSFIFIPTHQNSIPDISLTTFPFDFPAKKNSMHHVPRSLFTKIFLMIRESFLSCLLHLHGTCKRRCELGEVAICYDRRGECGTDSEIVANTVDFSVTFNTRLTSTRSS